MKIKHHLFLFTIAVICVGTLSAQDTQGFFLSDHQPKKVIVPKSKKIKITNAEATVRVEVNVDDTIATVSKYLFGNNTNPYMSQIVTEPRLLQQIQVLQPNILRFPGGNISNVYFWNYTPNSKPADVPDTILYGDKRKPKREKSWVGKDENPNSLTLANYYKLLQQTNSTGTICVNAGYARYGTSATPIVTAAHYAAEWVRFDKGRTKFWEVGNEDYGTWQPGYKIDISKNKDGQTEITSGELYGKIFKAFSDSMHAAAKEIGSKIHVGATILEAAKNKKFDNEVDKNWNSGFFKSAKNTADFFIIHSYYTPYNKDSKPDEILATATSVSKKMMQYMKETTVENHVDLKPIALTEWNIFSEGSKQQTSYVNGLHAAIVLGELAKNKYGMACRWDLANGYSNGNDHGMFNKGDEPGMPKWSARPAFYTMYYFQKFFGDKVLAVSSSNETIIAYASTFSDGKKGLVLINKDTTGKTISIHLNKEKSSGGKCYGYTITGGNDNGLFSQKLVINGVEPSLPAGGPDDFESIKAWSLTYKNYILLTLPAMAAQYILINQ